jgi:hypothetical protein
MYAVQLMEILEKIKERIFCSFTYMSILSNIKTEINSGRDVAVIILRMNKIVFR